MGSGDRATSPGRRVFSRVHVTLLVLAWSGSVRAEEAPREPPAETRSSETVEEGRTTALGVCPIRDDGLRAQATVERRLGELDRELSARSLKWPLVALGTTSLAFLSSTILVASLARSPGWWAVPGTLGAGVGGALSAVGVRVHRRRPYVTERARLRREQLRLAYQLAAVSQECRRPAEVQDAARQRLEEIDRELAALQVQARTISTLGPKLLMVAGGVATGGFLLGTVLALVSFSSDEHVSSKEQRVVRGLGAGIGVGAALLIGGGVWMGRRRGARRDVLMRGEPLREERRKLQTVIRPEVGPTSFGVSFHLQF